jgi:hypothetical protein
MPVRTWTMTGDSINPWLDSLDIGPNDVPELPGEDWAIHKGTLRGGRREGVETIELNNGPLSLTVLPTRGMGIWKGDFRGLPLGWDSPVGGPVHPTFVNLADRGGLGWLTGFDEWLCRCGLVSNGPPCDDRGTPLTIHGRIANSPAQLLTIGVDPEQSRIFVRGVVEEGGLFLGRMRLTSTVWTSPESSEFTIHDVVENRSGQPTEMQLLYHLNTGLPFLESGSSVHVPFAELAPHTAHAAKALDRWQTLAGPVAGFAEEVFDFKPASVDGKTMALLCNGTRTIGLEVHWQPSELPCFTIWKNTVAKEDGYVVGLEPSTNYPYPKTHERQNGRVVKLPPGGKWEATLRIRICDNPGEVKQAIDSIATIQSKAGQIHEGPVWGPK